MDSKNVMELKNQEPKIGSVFESQLGVIPDKNQHGHVKGSVFSRQKSSPGPSPTSLTTKKRTNDAKYPDSSPDTVNLAQEEKLKQKNAEIERERLEKEVLIKQLQETNAKQNEANEGLQSELEALKLKWKESNKTNQTLLQQVEQQREAIATETAQKQKQLDEKKQEVELLKVERDQVVEENKTLKARIEELTLNEATIAVKTRQDLIRSIAGELVTETEIRQSRLTATEVLEVLWKLGSPPNGQTLTGTLLTAKKAQAVLVVQNSIQNFTLEDLLEFKALIDAKKQEDTVVSPYLFIRQEQDFFRCRYGNTKTWETIMGLVKDKLKECLEAQTDQLTDEQKSEAKAIFQTHRQHGYGFGFFSTPKIPPSLENKLAAAELVPS